ncbi:SWIM zinc finger protein [Stagonosporopsis vannaccii]|nr:SWIM zinc finger protein [Stagonosporopsis vannaccii]
MTASKARHASRKKNLNSVGSRVVSFRLNNFPRHYTVHNDLICRTSAYFRSRLQMKRKPVYDACSICFEDQDPGIHDITFWSTCGQNFHETCIDEWSETGSTCPMCKAMWSKEPPLSYIVIDQELDGNAMQVYLDWLYSGEVRIDAPINRETDTFSLLMLKCWELSTAFEDDMFWYAIIRIFFAETEARFRSRSIKFAFEDRNDSEMRRFVVEVVATRLDVEWFKKKSGKWPKAFVQELADYCLEQMISGTERPDVEGIEAALLEGLEGLGETDAEDEGELASDEEYLE